MKIKSTSRLAFPLASAIAALLASSSVHADQIWDGGSTGPGDDNWNTAANWGLNTLPTFTNAITFTGNVRNGAVNDLTAASVIGGINLTNDGTAGKTNAFTLSGNSITLGGNIVTTTSSSAITDTISLATILNADRTITTNTNHNLTVSGIISQTGGNRRLTKDGAGILTLSGVNSYAGGTTINAGTLNVANVSGLGATGSMVSLGASSTLRLSTDTAFGSGGNPVYNVEMKNPGPYASTIELNRATAGTYTGITHNFGLLEISLNGGTTATLNVTAGANAAGSLDTIAFTSMRAGNNNLVTETLNPTGGNISIGTLKAYGTHQVTMNLSGTTAGNAITGVIGGLGSEQLVAISKIGTSTWTLSNAGNNYTGGTTFSAGTLVFANGALGTTGTITASGGTLRWASGNTQDISNRLAMTAATSTFDTNGNNVTFASAIGSSVAAALTKTGTGTLTLQGTNTYTGATTVNLGTLTLDYGTNDTSKLANAAALTLGGGTVNLAGATGSHVEVVASTTLTAGTGSYVTRTGLNTAVLQLGTINNNTTGTLNIGGAGMATANNTHTAGTILGTWATVGGDWAITAASGTNIPITAYASYTDVNRLGGAIATSSSTNVRIIEAGVSGNISMAAGTTSINTLNQSATGGTATIDTASKILQTNGILMGPTAGALTIGASPGSGTLSSTAATGSIVVTNNSSNTLTINSVIANNTTTSLVKTGTGVLVLNGSNTYLGGTTLQDGTLRVGATVGSMNSNGILGGTFNTGLIIANKSTAVFDVNGQTAYIKDLQGGGSLGGNVTLGSGTLQIRNPSNAANPYGGIISGTGNLIVGDTSAWVTTSAHTYTGTTTAFSGAYYASILADGGVASGIGQSSSAANNLIINVGTLSYNGTSAASTNRQFTLAGNGGFGVQSTGAITWSYTGAVTYSGAGTKTLNFSGGGTGLGTLAASIGDNSGSAISVAKTGSSTWALSGANNYTGTTTVSAGTLALDYSTQDNSKLSNSAALILGGGTVSLSGGTHTEVVGSTTLQAGTTSNITRPSGASVLQLGTVTVNTGASLILGAGGIATTNTTNNSLGVLPSWVTISGGWAVNSTNGANGLITAATYSDVSRLSSGTKTIASSAGNYRIIEGTGTVADVTMAAGGTTSVNTLVNNATTAGTVAVGTGNTLSTGAILQSTGAATLTIGTFGATAGSLRALSAGGNLGVVANSVNGVTINSLIADNSTSTLTKEGSGTVTLTGANTYAGGTTISAGVLAVGLNLGGVGGDSISPDGTSTSLGSGAVSVAAGAALHINTAGLTIANNITLNGLSYGVNSGGPAATNTGPWNGAIMANSKNGATSNTFSGTITLNATSNVSTNWSDKTMIITGKVTGAGGLTFDNSAPAARQGGVFQLGNTTNDYAGDTTINNGNSGAQPTLILGASNVIPNGAGKGNVNVLGNLNLNGSSDTINGLSGSGVITNGVTLTTSTLTVGDNNAPGFTFSGIIQNGTGTVALTKIGTGTQTLSGTAANTYGGTTTISGGILALNKTAGLNAIAGAITLGNGATTAGNDILRLDASNQIADAAVITFNAASGSNAGILRLNNQSETVAGIASTGGGGIIENESGSAATGTLTVNNSAAQSFSGIIRNGDGSGTDGTLALTKTGNGILTLGGNNNYTGATNVNVGTLRINGNQTAATGAVSIASGATLGGSGTLGGAVTVNSGGFHAAGNSIGTQTMLAGYTQNGTEQVELGTPGGTPAAGVSDRTVVTGALNLGGASTLQLIDNAGANAQGSMGAGAYRLITFSGTRTGTFNTITNPLNATLHEKVVYNGTSNGSVDLEVYRLATANAIGTPANLTNVRVGGTFGTSALSIQNTASNDGFSEGLNATQGAVTGHASVSGTNITNLAGGSSISTISVGLGGAANTGTAGAKTGTVAIGLASNGTNSGYANTALTGQTVTVNGAVYNAAVANTITSPVTLTKIRVGDSFGTSTLSISNTAPSGAFTEGLNATVGSTTGDASGSGSVSNLAGGSSSTSITVGLAGANTSTSGIKTGSVNINLASSGTNSGLADLGLGSQTVGVSGTVYEYADAVFSKTGGDGNLSGGSNSYTLDFGTGLALNTTYTATIQLANTLLSSFQDDLGGSYGSIVSSEFNSGVEGTTIASLVAGSGNTFTVTFFTGSTGIFSDTLTFSGLSKQSGLSDASLGNFNIALTAVAVPEPRAALLGGIGLLMLLRRRRS